MKEEYFKEFNESTFEGKKFSKVIFSLLRAAEDIVTKGELTKGENVLETELEQFVQELFVINPNLKEDILVRSSSKLELIQDVSYEILTKRNKYNPTLRQ